MFPSTVYDLVMFPGSLKAAQALMPLGIALIAIACVLTLGELCCCKDKPLLVQAATGLRIFGIIFVIGAFGAAMTVDFNVRDDGNDDVQMSDPSWWGASVYLLFWG